MNLDGAVTAPAAGSGSAAVPAAAAQDGPGGKPASGPADYVYEFDRPPSVPRPELTRLLGGKAANLVDMATGLGLPVPPGFTIATTACNSYLTAGWPAGLDEQLRVHVRRVGERIGRHFGDPDRPLLVSVRSGAPVSMPGMMDTILDLGLNDATAAGLAALTSDPEFADDCLRRFRHMYREIVGCEAPDDPWLQLRGAVEAVFRSWNGDRARAYRAHEAIPDDLGTGVTVQAMVFGNLGADSGTGVLFTRSPATGERALYGDVMFRAQGEDVVAGTHRPQHLDILDGHLPAVAAELRRYAAVLEHFYADLCDIEFTIEQGKLWLLQVRVGKRSPRAALRIAVEMAQDPDFPCSREEAVRRTARYLASPPFVFVATPGGPAALTTGLGASPGVATGEIATTPEAAELADAAGRQIILVREETSPSDVRGMAHAAGILTARGGLVSHAAVVARGWGIPAVVGAGAVEVADRKVMINGRAFTVGDHISIDGSTGEVYLGDVAGSRQVAPEAAVLLGWAEELGIDVGRADAGDSPQVPAPEGTAGTATEDDLLRALAVKGAVPADQLATAVACEPGLASSLTDRLLAAGLAEASSFGYRLTAEGKLKASTLFAADRDQLGADRSAAFLEAFRALDAAMKETVTAWQLRAEGGEMLINDHSDPAYDEQVLGRLSGLHRDTLAWIAPLAVVFPRFGRYQARLDAALVRARDGDQRYVSSPRVDSYHSVWFELHEDLIRLSGHQRSDEPAAEGG